MSTFNANGSKWLAAITILTFILGALLPAFVHSAFHAIPEAILLVGTAVTAIIGFKNTFETNDPWKTVVQVASAAANLIVPAIFIAITNNG